MDHHDGIEIDDIDLETVSAANMINNLVAFGYGFVGIAAAPMHAVMSEIFKPGSFKQVFVDYFAGKYLPK